MKYIKMLGLLAIAAAALMAFAGTASASTLTSPEGTTYTGNFTATSTNLELHGSFVTIKCTHPEMKGSVEQHGAANAGGKISSLTFTGCNYPTTVTAGGIMVFTSANGALWSLLAWHLHTSVGTCTFTTNNTPIGTLVEGKNAYISINSAKIPRTGGNFLCGSSGTLTGTYDLTTPNDLWVD